MPNTPEAIISFYALNKIGAVANMIHPLSTENEIKHFLNVFKSKYMIATRLYKKNKVKYKYNMHIGIFLQQKKDQEQYICSERKKT